MIKTNQNIDHWQPENEKDWFDSGREVAWRNLRWSVFSLILAFMVWMVWSALVVYLKEIRPDFSISQLYWLTALPLLTAAFLRIVYSFTVPIYGGRNWTVFSTLIMLIPLIGTYFCFSYTAPYWVFALMALLTGTGGANFASSSANISFFFPHRLKSIALGINAAIGNMGVGLIQLLIPYIIAMNIGAILPIQNFTLASGIVIEPQVIPLFLSIFVLIAAIGSWLRMNNISPVKTTFSDQKAILHDKDCWLMSVLYTFTFGSFIGFAAILPIMIFTLFDRIDFASYAFAGALLSSVMRPLGHVIAKWVGAVKLTLFVFSVMILGLASLLFYIPSANNPGDFMGFMASYMVIFLGTGLGKGSTTSMIPEIYLMRAKKSHISLGGSFDDHQLTAARKVATVLGLTSAIATFGAFLIPKVFSVAQEVLNDITIGIWFFIMANFSCLIITWWFYQRKVTSNPLYIKDKNGHDIIVDKPSLHEQLG